MRINFVGKGALLVATLCVASTALPASPKANQSGSRAVTANKGASPNDTSFLLQQIQSEAIGVQNNAAQLATLLRAPFLNFWQADAEYLENAGADVNKMNKLLLRLRAEEENASPSQQKVIERIASTAVNLADTTQIAVDTLHDNQSRVFATNLDALAHDMLKQASLIEQAAANLQKYTEARHEVQQLKQTLRL